MTAFPLYFKNNQLKKNQSFRGRVLAAHGILHLHLANVKLYNSLFSVIFCFLINVFKAEREILHLHLAVPGRMQAALKSAPQQR